MSLQHDWHFAQFAEHKSLLTAVAYRMLGSMADAEDMVQETYLRWMQTSSEDIESPRAFLITIVSRLCLNYLKSARVLREQYVGQWLPEPVITEPTIESADRAELNDSLSLAFMVLMERLNPVERAVFLLREVFDFDYVEIARILEVNEPNCRQILRRARQHMATVRPRFKAHHPRHRELLARFVEASSSGNLKALVEMLEADAVLYSDGGGKSFALPNPIYGAENIARAIVQGGQRFRSAENVISRTVDVNGMPGIVAYLGEQPLYVVTIDTACESISNIYFITNPDKLSRVPPLKGN